MTRAQAHADSHTVALPRRRRQVPRGIVTVKIIGSRAATAEWAGPGVLDAFRTLGVPYMRARTGGAWWCPSVHAGDVMALLETRRYRIDPVL